MDQMAAIEDEVDVILQSTQPETQPYSQESASSKKEERKASCWAYLMWHSYNLPRIYELTEQCHVFGKRKEHDFIFDEKLHKIPAEVMLNISRTHFKITRNEDGTVVLKDQSINGTFVNKKKVGESSTSRPRKVVLQDHDVISLIDPSGLSCQFTFAGKENELEKDLPSELLERFRVTRTLGKGGSATVYLAYENSTCKPFAVKRIDKDFKTRGMNSEQYIQAEIKILKSLYHPNIVAVKDVIDVERQTFIVMEYMQGGSLAQIFYKQKQKPFDEKLCKVWFYQLLLSLEYLDSKSIIHRDVKMENILVCNNTRNSPIKLADFGLSKMVSQSRKAVTCCGSYEYVAPEVISSEGAAGEPYSSKVDIWSLGVTLFVCLSGKMPFASHEPSELKQEILSGKLKMDGPEWDSVSDAAKLTVRNMLRLNPNLRLGATELMQSAWFNEKNFQVVKEVCKRPHGSPVPPRFSDQNTQPAPAKVAKVEKSSSERISPVPSSSKCTAF
ncbi:ovarian-specific serine/threonine-protein kinase Lok-like isoform X1 [Cloeon dipterum]|uniref:ovarian-specific serine/threonine-protein kinase Lok-like isoform X1 n=1 Tax=Cloeon dipterum TaxID=197152 RepID=UPI003220382F